jgi:hypothetical protein
MTLEAPRRSLGDNRNVTIIRRSGMLRPPTMLNGNKIQSCTSVRGRGFAA